MKLLLFMITAMVYQGRGKCIRIPLYQRAVGASHLLPPQFSC